MAQSKGSDKVEKKGKKDKKTKDTPTSSEKTPKASKKTNAITTKSAFSLLADEKSINPTLSSLFTAQPTPLTRPIQPTAPVSAPPEARLEEGDDTLDEPEVAQDAPPLASDSRHTGEGDAPIAIPEPEPQKSKHKRKRKDEEEEQIEDAYMRRLAREEDREAKIAADERSAKRQKSGDAAEEELESEDDAPEQDAKETDHPADSTSEAGEDAQLQDGLNDEMSPPPKHETEQAADDELDKANRTVFLGNVSTAAISSKSYRRALMDHLKSFFDKIAEPKDGQPKHVVESIRFRSTPYATTLPKKAAFAKKEVMDATSKSTNAYAIYSSPSLARQAVKHLNGTMVLDRHLRVDLVAHPAPVDNRRCVFVGNLGFVDDESNIQDANEAEGKEVRKRSKHPADVEEGLWRTFGRCGKVESVRVIRDSATRVGKGIAYVQFDDENAVEAALGLNEKKFPPMLPRKLRVSRAKAIKRNAKPAGRGAVDRTRANGYRRKVTGGEASREGRAS